MFERKSAHQKQVADTTVWLSNYEAAPRAAAEADTAVIVCHGMGQQVPFQTLSEVADALLLADREAGNVSPGPSVTLLPRAKGYLPRAEVTVKDRAVHLYEVYWAPITEGQIKAFDVLRFLLEAGWKGFWRACAGSFRRFLYGDWRKLRIGRLTAVMILATFAVVVSLLAHYFAFGIVAAYRISRALGLSVFTPDAIKYSTANWTWLVILGVLLAGLFGLFGIIRRATITDAGWDQPNPWRKMWLWVQLIVTILCLVVPLIFADLVLVGERFSVLNVTPAWVENFVFEAETPAVFAVLLLWGWALWYVKEKLVQYVGDVAAYISAHKLNRFAEIRDRIERCALEIGSRVYGDSRYTRIILVGHSLGSVVAYDLYNCLLREDRIDGGERRNVAERTRLLITFGSPLDKTAFLFRQQGEPGLAGVREALSAAMQPLVANFANWPQGWINIYSPADIISEAVNYYHLPPGEGAHGQRTVDNCVDYEANWPLLAHNQYWENRRLRQVLYDAVCGEVYCGKSKANSENAKAAACTK